MEYKPGDKVRVRYDACVDDERALGALGVIIWVDEDEFAEYPYCVDFSELYFDEVFMEEELELYRPAKLADLLKLNK